MAIGEATALAGYALAGAELLEARDRAAVVAAWEGLSGDVGLVVLSAQARGCLPEQLDAGGRLWLSLPE